MDFAVFLWFLEFWVIPGQFTWEAKKTPSVDKRPKMYNKKKFKVKLNFLKVSNIRFFLLDPLNSSLAYPPKNFKSTNLDIIPVDTPKFTWLEKNPICRQSQDDLKKPVVSQIFATFWEKWYNKVHKKSEKKNIFSKF